MPPKKGCLPRRSSTPTNLLMSRSPSSISCSWSPWHRIDKSPRYKVRTGYDPTMSRTLARMGRWSAVASAAALAGRMVEKSVEPWVGMLVVALAERMVEKSVAKWVAMLATR